MRRRSCAAAAALVVSISAMSYAQISPTSGPAAAPNPKDQSRPRAEQQSNQYLTPPKAIVDMLDAPPTPNVIVSPDRRTIALLSRKNMPSIADLAEPIHRIAGLRINPQTNGRQQRGGATIAITLKSIADGTEKRLTTPPNPNLGSVSFSPDGQRLFFTNTKANGIELWVAETATGRARLISGKSRLNGTAGPPCEWQQDGVKILCQLVPADRGPVPARTSVPSGPNIQENYGKAAPAATYEDLIKNAYDEDLFEYYFTGQLAAFDAASGRQTLIGRPAILEDVSESPNGQYLLVSRIKRPFSRLVPMGGFARELEIWNQRGEIVKKIADLPSSEGTPIGGVRQGPRAQHWRRDQPANLVWTEALDEGNPRNKVPFRDRIVELPAPFNGTPAEIAKTAWRYGGLAYTEKGVALLSESDRQTRRTRTWLLEAGAQPRVVWDRRQQDAYQNPGSPVNRLRGGLILQHQNYIYLTGPGASPEGNRPFLDRLDLKTLKTERLFRSAEKTYETVVTLLDDEAKTILTEYETPADPPNYYLRDLGAATRRAVTAFKDPMPQLTGVEKQFVTYQRKDGVKLSGTLYLPPGYRKGERLPVLMWAYPREFTDTDTASQITGSPYRFIQVGGPSHLFLLTQGYAIFDNPAMPIVGPGETANDTYVEQLVADAEAAIDKVVEMGVADRDRIGIGGHSYGAFMTANLLAHSNLFRAGIARSGAYNRTLTPFGFQSEQRTFWEAPEVYAKMSPFWYANKINEPILLIHGEADDNSGTFPIQTERLYLALKGHGATMRYVTLPFEAHGYTARESVLHTLAEMINWMDRYVKNAGRKEVTER
ncbi:MAG TPA: prolyl oligopeptidase family serine peptidase [Blastocatellia bacterium]|nr:prolyl oligopeptidase family serine peptidase [Blastocatellia bacterium]